MTATNPAGPLSGKAAGGHGDAATPEEKEKAGAEPATSSGKQVDTRAPADKRCEQLWRMENDKS
jgi:hypothetical protein